MKVKSESEVAQSCPTLSDRMDYSPPGSSIHGIFQARVLEWGAIAFSGGQANWVQIQIDSNPNPILIIIAYDWYFMVFLHNIYIFLFMSDS